MFGLVWQVLGSNQRRRCRQIYSPVAKPPLTSRNAPPERSVGTHWEQRAQSELARPRFSAPVVAVTFAPSSWPSHDHSLSSEYTLSPEVALDPTLTGDTTTQPDDHAPTVELALMLIESRTSPGPGGCPR